MTMYATAATIAKVAASSPNEMRPALFATEAAIAVSLIQGRSVRDIATARGSTTETVRSQVKSLRRKLGVDSQLAAVAAMNRFSGDVSALELTPSLPRPRAPASSEAPRGWDTGP